MYKEQSIQVQVIVLNELELMLIPQINFTPKIRMCLTNQAYEVGKKNYCLGLWGHSRSFLSGRAHYQNLPRHFNLNLISYLISVTELSLDPLGVWICGTVSEADMGKLWGERPRAGRSPSSLNVLREGRVLVCITASIFIRRTVRLIWRELLINLRCYLMKH